METFLENTKILRHSNAVAAGATVITPASGVDTKGFESCTFVVAFGAITENGVQSIEVHQSDDDGVADAYGSLEGSKITVADDDDNQLAAVEIVRPQKRYLKCIVNRATQNAVLDGIVAILSNPHKAPTTHDATTVVGAETHHSPDEGTA